MIFDLFPEDINNEQLVGFVKKKLPKLENKNDLMQILHPFKNTLVIENILKEQEIDQLKDFFFRNDKISTKKDTIKLLYGQEPDGIQRSSYYDKNFSIKLSKRINKYLDQKELNYELIGVNPLIRFIYYYKKDQKLIPHYDTSVNINEKVITLKTLIIYLKNSDSGHTNFLKDTRHNSNSDSFEKYPIVFQQKPKKGLALIFNHGVFHESENIQKNDTKLIITTEICYKKST